MVNWITFCKEFCDAELLHAVNEIPANNAAHIKPIFFMLFTPQRLFQLLMTSVFGHKLIILHNTL